MDIEWSISRYVQKSQVTSKRRHVHEILPCLETDTRKVGLGADLLQVRDNLNCGYDQVADNAMLQPITFASKSLSSAD